MNRSGAVARHWPALIVGVALVVLILLAVIGDSKAKWHTPVVAVVTAVPILISISQYLYQRVDSYYLAVNRVKLSVLNPNVRVGVSADFLGTDPVRAMKEALAEVEGRAAGEARRLGQIEDGTIWAWNGLTLRLRTQTDSDPVHGEIDSLRLEIPESAVSYRAAIKSLENDLGPLLCDLDQALESESRKFVLSIHFAGTNPYFGAFVKTIPREHISTFNMRILESDTTTLPQDVIAVRENSLQIVAAKAHSLQRLGLRYLRLLP